MTIPHTSPNETTMLLGRRDAINVTAGHRNPNEKSGGLKTKGLSPNKDRQQGKCLSLRDWKTTFEPCKLPIAVQNIVPAYLGGECLGTDGARLRHRSTFLACLLRVPGLRGSSQAVARRLS